MFTNWLRGLLPQPVQQTGNQPLPPPALTPSPSPSLATILPTYAQALAALDERSPDTLLSILLTRDQIEMNRQQDKSPSPQAVQQLITLDEQLRQRITTVVLLPLSGWRQSLRPPPDHWWWYLDEAAAEKEKEKDFLWQLLAVAFFVLTVPLATDIIRRLWAHAPDNVAIVSTLLTLLITASPFTQNGRELMRWLLRRIPRLPTTHHAKTMAATAFVAFLLTAGLHFLCLPRLATLYNDQGVAAIEAGQLTTARQKLQRAIALNNDLAPSYYNLAAAYEKIGRYEEAINWYQRALDYDLQFAPAYNNIGRLYLQQGQPAEAQTVLAAGLVVLDSTLSDSSAERVTRYRLLTHLGQAYYEQAQFDLAAPTLEEAIALEQDGALDAQFFVARPHVYLAQSYEALAEPSADIIRQWEAALSYLSAEDPASWGTIIEQQLRFWRASESEQE